MEWILRGGGLKNSQRPKTKFDVFLSAVGEKRPQRFFLFVFCLFFVLPWDSGDSWDGYGTGHILGVSHAAAQ